MTGQIPRSMPYVTEISENGAYQRAFTHRVRFPGPNLHFSMYRCSIGGSFNGYSGALEVRWTSQDNSNTRTLNTHGPEFISAPAGYPELGEHAIDELAQVDEHVCITSCEVG